MPASSEQRPAGLEASDIESRLRPVFESHPEILCAYLFGSRARGRASSASDYDLAVFRRPGDYTCGGAWQTYWGDLHSELATALRVPSDRVDLVLLDESKDPVLRHRATWMAKRILCRDDAARLALETATLIQLMDTQHLRNLQRDAMKRALGVRRGT